MTRNKIIYFLFVGAVLCGCTANKSHYIGEKYIGKQYLNNPLGEEKQPDPDPLIRQDAFDCTTFVETTLADGNVKKLNAIRYKNGDIDFVNRNHFIELDWLQNNQDIVENVSNLYGKTAIRTVIIDKKSWFKKNYNIDTEFEKRTVNLEYIPYENLSNLDIQTPLIVLFVHDGHKFKEKIGTDLAVVHMGFLLPDGTLRHASRRYGRVMDTDFMEYVSEHRHNKHNIGIVLVKIK